MITRAGARRPPRSNLLRTILYTHLVASSAPRLRHPSIRALDEAGIGFRILLRRRYLFLSRPAAPAEKCSATKSSRQRPMGAMKRRRRSVRKRNRQRIAVHCEAARTLRRGRGLTFSRFQPAAFRRPTSFPETECTAKPTDCRWRSVSRARNLRMRQSVRQVLLLAYLRRTAAPRDTGKTDWMAMTSNMIEPQSFRNLRATSLLESRWSPLINGHLILEATLATFRN
jgi:hypothetical protein